MTELRARKATRLGEGTVLGAELAGAVTPVLDEVAAPRLGEGGVTGLVGGAVGEAAVSALEHDAGGGGVVPELGAEEGLRDLVVLDPVDKVLDNVVGGRSGSAVLAELPGTGTGDAANTAVGHTGDAEETEEVVDLGVVKAKLVGELEVMGYIMNFLPAAEKSPSWAEKAEGLP